MKQPILTGKGNIVPVVTVTVFILCALWARIGMALDPAQYSETEKVGFAFHQLLGSEPDFEIWIKDSQSYKDALPVEKMELMKQEKLRLKNGLYNYFPDNDLIHLNMPAEVRLQKKDIGDETGAKGVTVNISFPEMPERGYLPFLIGNIWVAIVIQDLPDITDMSLTMDQFEALKKRAHIAEHANSTIRGSGVDLYLRPLSVDTSAPIIMDGYEMWLMLADVGEMTLWKQKGPNKSAYFTYTAPWYISSNRQELLDLYREFD